MSGAQSNNHLGNSFAFIYFGKRRYIYSTVEYKFMCLTHSEAKQMETSVSLEQRRVYARLSKKNGWLTLKRPRLLEGFQGRAFKGRLR